MASAATRSGTAAAGKSSTSAAISPDDTFSWAASATAAPTRHTAGPVPTRKTRITRPRTPHPQPPRNNPTHRRPLPPPPPPDADVLPPRLLRNPSPPHPHPPTLHPPPRPNP